MSWSGISKTGPMLSYKARICQCQSHFRYSLFCSSGLQCLAFSTFSFFPQLLVNLDKASLVWILKLLLKPISVLVFTFTLVWLKSSQLLCTLGLWWTCWLCFRVTSLPLNMLSCTNIRNGSVFPPSTSPSWHLLSSVCLSTTQLPP